MRQSCVLLSTIISCAMITTSVFAPALIAQKRSATKTGGSGQFDKTVLATVGKETITYRILEDAYRKNMNNKTVQLSRLSLDSTKDFLNLYLNYRLKVLDARDKGLDKKPEIVNDIRQNRASLAAPYLFEKKIITPNTDLAFERRKQQVKIGLIFSRMPANGDTMPAFKRSQAILALLNKGEDFAKLAKDSTDDEYFKPFGGELPFVTSVTLLRELENAAYTMKPGQIYPRPIRSGAAQPGYHVMKLIAIEPRVSVWARHILFKYEPDSATGKRRADSALQRLRSGEKFEALATKLSDDAPTRENGGRFPSFYTPTTGYLNGQRYRLADTVEKWLFAAGRKDGDVSEPLPSVFGWHIVRRDTSKLAGDDREELKRYYKRVFFETDKKAFFDSVKKARKYSFNEKAFNDIFAAIDTTKPAFDSAQNKRLPEKLQKEILCKSIGFTLTVKDFGDSLATRPDLRGFSPTKQGLQQGFERVVETGLLNVITKNLEIDFPDFGSLMKEFEEGILIFRVEEQEVWSKMKFDTARARAFHEPIKNRFTVPTKYDFSEIFVWADSTAKTMMKQLQSGVPFDTLAKKTQRTGYAERLGRWDVSAAQDNELAGELAKRGTRPKDVIGPIPFIGGFSIVRLNNIEPSRVKTFEEAIPDFAAQFQDATQKELNQKWISGLREKHPITVNFDSLKKIWK